MGVASRNEMQDHVHGSAGLLILIGIRALSAVSLGLVQIGDFDREGPLCLRDKNSMIGSRWDRREYRNGNRSRMQPHALPPEPAGIVGNDYLSLIHI